MKFSPPLLLSLHDATTNFSNSLKKKCLLWLASQAGEARLKLMFRMDMFFCIKLVLCINLDPVTNFLCELSMLKVFICMIFFYLFSFCLLSISNHNTKAELSNTVVSYMVALLPPDWL